MQVDLDERYAEVTKCIKTLCDLDEKAIVEQSLLLLAWAVLEVRKGYTVASYDSNEKTIRQIEIPAFKLVKKEEGTL